MTTWWGWATRRARSSLVLLATLFALVAVTTGILAFALGNSGALATSAARAALASADPAEAGVRAQTRLAPDADAQDALAREKLTEGFAPAPISVWTTYVSEPRPGTGPDGALKERLILWSGEHLSPDVLEVDGQWPAASGQAALHRDAAATLGLELGDPLTVDDHELTITALWAPADPADPRWFADDLALRGADGVHLGPLVVDRSVLTGGQPFVQWGVVPDAEHISASDLGALAAGAERAKALVEEADVTGRGITTEGNLAPTAARAARELAVAEAFGFVPVSLLLLVAVVGLVQVAGLLAATREKELNLLFARGSSTGQVLGAGIVEAVVVALLGDAVGTGAAALVVRLTSGTWEHTPAVLGGGLASLAVGQIVEVYGYQQAAGQYLATRIDDEDDTPTHYKLRGVVSGLDTTARSFRIGATLVSYAEIAGAVPGLANGQYARVELQLTPAASGAWRARRIQVAGTAIGVPQAGSVKAEIEGYITAFTSSARFSVHGVTVDASGVARLPTGLALGRLVEVEGVLANGVLVADSVEIEDDGDDDGKFEIEGAIASVSPGTRSFVVHGVTVDYATARFKGGTVEQLAAGVKVEVEGLLASDGTTVVATEIEFDD